MQQRRTAATALVQPQQRWALLSVPMSLRVLSRAEVGAFSWSSADPSERSSLERELPCTGPRGPASGPGHLGVQPGPCFAVASSYHGRSPTACSEEDFASCCSRAFWLGCLVQGANESRSDLPMRHHAFGALPLLAPHK